MTGEPLAVTYLPSAAAALMTWLGYALALGTLAAVLTWILVRLLGRYARPPLELALWTIVLLKFLIPSGPGWSLSLESLCSGMARGGLAETLIEQVPAFGALADATLVEDGQAAISRVGGQSAGWSWTGVAAPAYLGILLVLAVRRWRSYRVFRAWCLSLSTADAETESLVRCICRRLHMRTMPLVRISREQRAPLVMGLLRPVLVLSHHQLLRPDELETVIVHELTHLRRGDLLVRALQCIAGTLLFFWPVVAWVNRRIDQAREQACDEWAIRHGKLSPGQYARCLLAAVERARPRLWAYQPACMAGRASTIESRIDVILSQPSHSKSKPIAGLLAFGLVLSWAALTLAGPAAGKHKVKQGDPEYAATEKEMRLHAAAVYALVNEYEAGDLNGDGEVTKEECWAFIAAVVMQQPTAILAEYTQADGNQDGVLELEEAYQFVRGDYDLDATHKRLGKVLEEAKKSGNEQKAAQVKADWFATEMETYHVILDRRARLLDMMTTEPDIATVQSIADRMAKHDAEMKTKGLLKKTDKTTQEIVELRAKASELRTAAASFSGKEATGRISKAEKLEQRADELSAKVTKVLTEHIAKLEQAGDNEEAEALKGKLAEFDEL